MTDTASNKSNENPAQSPQTMPPAKSTFEQICLPASLIVCTRNRHQLVCDLVTSVLDAREVPSELIIVDQSDTPLRDLPDKANQSGCIIRYEWSVALGVSHARNKGARLAQYDILAFIDDDMWVTPDWYGRLIDALIKSENPSVVTGRVESEPTLDGNRFVPPGLDSEEANVYRGRLRRDVLSSGHMALYRSTYFEIGGFDERLGPGTRFPAAEDNELGYRLLEAGYQIVYVPESVIFHRAWRRREDYLRLQWNYGRGQGAFYAKHLRLRDRHIATRLLRDFVYAISIFPKRLWTRQLLVILGSGAFVLGQWRGLIGWVMTNRFGRQVQHPAGKRMRRNKLE